jgi:hypothetical protein
MMYNNSELDKNLVSFNLDRSLLRLADLEDDLRELEDQEPIGLEFTKGDKVDWSIHFHRLNDFIKNERRKVLDLLDIQLDQYFNLLTPWNKKTACQLLKARFN